MTLSAPGQIGTALDVPSLPTASEHAASDAPPAAQACVVATFTADPLCDPLRHVLSVAGHGGDVRLAAYGQVFQELLRPDSMFAANRNGANVVLIRLEDWAGVDRHALDTLPAEAAERASIERNARGFVEALRGACARFSVSTVVVLCPESAALASSEDASEFLGRVAGGLRDAVGTIRNASFLGADEIRASYPVSRYDDASRNRIGHIPYTADFFAALALAVARRIRRLSSTPYKVIALDLDNTLWSGIVGEDGADGIVIDAHRRALQEFMLSQARAGVVLCICSKNNEEDVWPVFERRPDMVLRREHFVTHRINWQPKSSSIRSMAAELNVGTDSVIFVDDDAAVCAEVRHGCPDVAVIRLPENPAEIPALLEHLWVFDRAPATREDTRRTEMYRQSAAREQARRSATSIDDFLASLGLEIEIERMRPEQLARVAQLTVRTNQFNCTTIRRSEAELESLLATGLECAVVSVKDRFGDYGLVGAMLYAAVANRLVIDSFMMSCRVLGRGVEVAMVAHLGAIAAGRSLASVDIRFAPTTKNGPALEFLRSIPQTTVVDDDEVVTYRLEAEYARALDVHACAPVEHEALRQSRAEAAVPSRARTIVDVDALIRIATDYRDPAALAARLSGASAEAVRVHAGDEPRTPIEAELTRIWTRELGIERIGVHDNFFDVGGDSLRAVSVLAEVEHRFGREPGLPAFLEAGTIARMAALLATPADEWKCLVPIQLGGDRLPLYCMHAAGGSVLFYKDLARRLGPEQPVYGLQAQGLSKTKPWHRRVEDMADCYVQEIRAFQPSGPYVLAGSSFGGVLAYEMARQLETAGERIALLAMFDTYGPGYPTYPAGTGRAARSAFRFASRVQTHWHNLARMTWRERSAYLVDRTERVRRRAKRGWRRRRNELAAEYLGVMGRPIPSHLMNTQNAILEALGAYRYPSYGGRITLFRARNQPLGAVPDPFLGWAGRAREGIDVHDIEGHHGAVTVDPHAAFLAERLAPLLSALR